MQIKITPLSPKIQNIEGVLRIRNYYYFSKFHSGGIVTEIHSDDKWLENEMSWVSRSELPFVTAMRHAHLKGDQCLSATPCLPIIRKCSPFYHIKTVDDFPSDDECMQLIYKYCGLVTDETYTFEPGPLNDAAVKEMTLAFDYKNDLLVRAASCLYKAYCLLETSNTFAEEIYINSFIALEAIIEDLVLKYGNRTKTVKRMSNQIKQKMPCSNFIEYEEEMRDMIRNDIIHPFRSKEKRKVDQPFLMADDVLEDLGFVDWIFKEKIAGLIS